MSAPVLWTASWIINMNLFRLTDCENITRCSAASSRALSHYWFLQREREREKRTQWLAVWSIINQSLHAQIGLINLLLVVKSLIATQTKEDRRQVCNRLDLETRQWFTNRLLSWDVTVVNDYWRKKDANRKLRTDSKNRNNNYSNDWCSLFLKPKSKTLTASHCVKWLWSK